MCIVQTYCSLILSQRAVLQEERSATIIASQSWAGGDSAEGIIGVLALREALGLFSAECLRSASINGRFLMNLMRACRCPSEFGPDLVDVQAAGWHEVRLGDFEGVRKFRSSKNSTDVEKSSLAAQASPRNNKKEFEYPLQRSVSFRTADMSASTLPADHRFHGRLFLYFASCYGE
jgi:hypothetical protein